MSWLWCWKWICSNSQVSHVCCLPAAECSAVEQQFSVWIWIGQKSILVWLEEVLLEIGWHAHWGSRRTDCWTNQILQHQQHTASSFAVMTNDDCFPQINEWMNEWMRKVKIGWLRNEQPTSVVCSGWLLVALTFSRNETKRVGVDAFFLSFVGRSTWKECWVNFQLSGAEWHHRLSRRPQPPSTQMPHQSGER